MVRALIIDDEKQARIYLAGHLALYCPEIKIIGEAVGVTTGIEAILELKPQLVFLDIHMKDGSGFEMLEKLPAQPDFEVIFVTAHDQFAMRAIKFSALDYLLKPVDPEDLQMAVQKATLRIGKEPHSSPEMQVLMEGFGELQKSRKKIVLNTAETTFVVRVADIVRCESESNYTTFFLRNEKPILTSRTLGEVEELLLEYGFERIHRSHLVNLDYLKSFEKQNGGFVILEDGARVPVASRKRERLLEILKDF